MNYTKYSFNLHVLNTTNNLMQNLKPLKRFGQNYLLDQNILNKIIEELNILPGDNIIEIGPGQGALTKLLLKKTELVTAVEIDKRVTEDLLEKFPSLKLINNDFLKINLNKLIDNKNQKIRIAGNIPYNLTSPIIFKLIKDNNIVQDAVLMVQHEVAKRMNGAIGTKDYGIFSVILQFFAEVKYCFKVSPNVFYPKPRVHSAVVHVKFKELNYSDEVKESFIKIVKASFGNRRKTLKNSLSNSIFTNINFADSGIDLRLRAEQLTISDFLKLAEFTRKKLNN